MPAQYHRPRFSLNYWKSPLTIDQKVSAAHGDTPMGIGMDTKVYFGHALIIVTSRQSLTYGQLSAAVMGMTGSAQEYG